MANLRFALFIVLFISISQNLYAQCEDYYCGHAKGWHWYEEPGEDESSEKEDPTAEVNAVKMTIQHALNQAIIHPTESNVKNYIALQNQLSNQSSQFASVWKKVLVENPEYDYSIEHPTNNIARQIENDQLNAKELDAITRLAKNSGLFFFYKSTCPYCKKFAPIVKAFAERYGLVVVPITIDGVDLPEFPHSFVDQGQSKKFNVTVEPSLFAVDPYTQKAYPIGFGFMSEEDLKQRILDIANHFRGDT
jgi:conjugal transfer pilus assembly protein TraF